MGAGDPPFGACPHGFRRPAREARPGLLPCALSSLSASSANTAEQGEAAMTMMLDTHDAAFASCGAEAKVRSSSCGVSRHASRRQPLACQWHLNGDGLLTCTWTPVPPAPISTCEERPGLATGDRREPSRSRGRLHPTMQSVAIAALMAATLFGLLICFTSEVGDFL